MSNDISQPTISIVVNNYNYDRYVAQALESALPQLQAGDELVVVDDGSTDGSLDILRRYEREHGIVLIAKANGGQVSAVSCGVEEARGDIVALLDADDCLLEDYLKRLREIYVQHPDVSYVYTRPEFGGPNPQLQARTAASLQRTELEPGKIGPTRWSTTLFREFAGAPTSGNSMRRELALKIVSLPEQLQQSSNINPMVARVLGINAAEARDSRITADGMIVRAASLLGAMKYYDDRPGFMYRIHGSNRYINTPWLGRWYLRRGRIVNFVRTALRHFDLRDRPSSRELREEIDCRHFGRRPLRRMQTRFMYALGAFRASGPLHERARTALCALGVQSLR